MRGQNGLMSWNPKTAMEKSWRQIATCCLAHRNILLKAPPEQQRYESKTGRFEEYSLSMLTHLADKGEITTCSQDPLCLACSEILPLVQKLSDQQP